MIKIINPSKKQFNELTQRPALSFDFLQAQIEEIFKEVAAEGDEALVKYTQQFDHVELDHIRVAPSRLKQAYDNLSVALFQSLKQAASNIRKFHEAQVPENIEVSINGNILVEQRAIPIDRIGIYIPGGSAPLISTILMLAIPANIAKCTEIALFSPPSDDGKIHPSILATAYFMGIQEVYQIGGAQAIAAMSLGTDSIKPVSKIFGPGNQYVTAAKEFALRNGTAFDLPAGPSELLIYTDGSGIPAFMAADLLSQAEHGADSQVILIAPTESVLDEVMQEINRQLKNLPRKEIAAAALEKSLAIQFESEEIAFEWINKYAPEHLIIASETPRKYIGKIRNAGSVFLGNYCPESAGDYASGTNHTLPTQQWAKSYSGVNMDAFYKKISYQEISRSGLDKLSKTITCLAREEQLEAHARAVEIRSSKSMKS